jgi:hypothetical protein
MLKYKIKKIIMKKNVFNYALLFILLTAFSGCQAIGDIFKTGVGVGIFVVIFIIVVIALIVSKSKGN